MFPDRARLRKYYIHNALCRMAIAIGADSMGHLVVLRAIIEKSLSLSDDMVCVGANDLYGAGLYGFGTFRFPAHDEHRLAQGWCFFLNTAGVGEDQIGMFHQVDKGFV